jgi:nitrous oxide reductase accessory protein NosL
MDAKTDESHGAVAGQVERSVRPPLRMLAGSDGYYLQSVGGGEDVLLQQPEPKWFEKLKNAEASAIAIAERTGIAVLVVRVMGRVVPWHQS